MKYTHGDVMGFIEMDFWGGGGNEIVSNSANPRIRHAFIKYKDVLAGQTWSTFMNTSAIPESADFAGATLGLVFIRQGQVRYTMGDFPSINLKTLKLGVVILLMTVFQM